MHKLLIIKHPNTDMAEIQTTDRLCDYQYYFNPPADEDLTPDFIKFRDELQSIHGFKKIEIGRHDIHMERFEVFEFDNLIPLVIDALKRFTGTAEYSVTMDDRAAKRAETSMYGDDRDDFPMLAVN